MGSGPDSEDRTANETGRGEASEGLTLLVVDDDPDLRLYVRQCVSGGATLFTRVLEAADGVRGLRAIRTERPDMVVCDLLMPRLGGLALCERLREDPHTSSIPLLLLTGAAGADETLRLARAAGAAGVLLKPFNARRLRAAIDEAMRARRENPNRPGARGDDLDPRTGEER